MRLPEIPIYFFNEPYLINECTVDSSRGRYARVCVEVDLKKPLVPQFILNDDIQRVKDEGFHLILYALSVGKNRMELCPKQNQTDGEDSPAAEEVAEKRRRRPWMFSQTRIRKSGRKKGLSDLGC